ncbi:hypothetical protein [Helcococcus sueciensis]|uniref:hypothetical protein n=1 Tax=Helcococcus sueciensis TaxID=241555 RepID=UPI0004280499|nr:hypothetical protein [Helcococcus sueciensis]
MKKIFKLFIILLLLVGQVGTVNVLAKDDEIIVNRIKVPIAISAYRDRVVPQIGTPQKIYVEESDQYGNLYGGYLKFERILNAYSTGYLLVRYSGTLDLIGKSNPR